MSRKHLENTDQPNTSTADRLLHFLKTRGPQQAADAGAKLGITAEAARQQFMKLATQQLVEVEIEPQTKSVGRPSQYWKLTQAGHDRFPDTHSELTIQLLDTVRQAFGDEAIDRLIDMREQQTLALYLHELNGASTLKERVVKLVQLRSREGYMAEYEEHEDGSFLLIENHCPICAAATRCQNFCRAELAVFQEVLQAKVERVEHILLQARRCAYRVQPH